jgi:hypothetical protein
MSKQRSTFELTTHGSGLSSTVTHFAYVCGRERLYIKMAESKGFEPLRPFLNDGLANRWLNHSPNSLLIVSVFETHSTTLLLNFLQDVLKQDGSEVCLLNAHRVVPWIYDITHVFVFVHNTIAM